MGSTHTISKFLTHRRWTGPEAARLILSAAEDLAYGREADSAVAAARG